MQWCTDRILNKVDIVYIPSLEAKYLFPYKDVRALPPAGKNLMPTEKCFTRELIYVGGISELYGFDILLEAFAILNEGENKEFHLTCICRENEFSSFEHPLKNAKWLEVHHTSEDGLKPYYQKASAGIISKRMENAYNQMAISVKLFEYLSYGLPVVSTASKATDKIILDNGIGVIAKSTKEDIAMCIKKLFSNEDEYYRYQSNVSNALLSENLWVHRVDQIKEDLIGG